MVCARPHVPPAPSYSWEFSYNMFLQIDISKKTDLTIIKIML